MTHDTDRLAAIEEAAAHHAAAIDEISAQMADQWAAIRRIESRLDRLISYLREARENEGGEAAPDRPPPHY